MKQCEEMKKKKKEYMILLILTDGEIWDKDDVIDLLVESGRLPLSIIVVGIGNGPWEVMHELDDNQL